MKIRYIALVILLVSGMNSVFSAEGTTDSVKAKLQPKLEFKYLKNSDGSRSLICTVRIMQNDNAVPLKNAVIKYVTGNDLSLSLGCNITDFRGTAICKVPAKYPIQINDEGKFSFRAEYAGNDSIESSSEEIKFMDATMEMSCNDADSIKKIKVRMYKEEKGSKVPLRDVKVVLYVPRMFSMLQIGEAKLDSSGYASFEFPANLPGDSIGNIQFLVKLEDHPDYGNIEKRETKKWGVATTKELLLEHRALWSQVAPVWMIITLAIMLTGVWAHYLYVVIQMMVINNKGKEHKIKTGKY